MRYAAEPAFVLHARPWRETSLLVEVLSAAHGPSAWSHVACRA
jgi:DNA repair protein RecO (recombination protein O)